MWPHGTLKKSSWTERVHPLGWKEFIMNSFRPRGFLQGTARPHQSTRMTLEKAAVTRPSCLFRGRGKILLKYLKSWKAGDTPVRRAEVAAHQLHAARRWGCRFTLLIKWMTCNFKHTEKRTGNRVRDDCVGDFWLWPHSFWTRCRLILYYCGKAPSWSYHSDGRVSDLDKLSNANFHGMVAASRVRVTS